jgi:uncharacterized protein with HEPN domain
VPSKNPAQRFEDILENIALIEEFTAGFDVYAFRNTPLAVYGVKHALLIISEAAKKLDPLAEEMCPEIAWRNLRGLGNHLRHEYDRIDIERIWLVVEKEIAPLKLAVQRALKTLEEGRT